MLFSLKPCLKQGGINISVKLAEVKYSASSSKEVDKAVDNKIRACQGSFDMGGVGAAQFEQKWIDALPADVTVINCAFNKFK